MTDRLRVSVAEGKYTVIQSEEGAMFFLRYGEPWDPYLRHLDLIEGLVQEVDMLRKECKRLNESLERVQGNFARSLRSVAEREFGEEPVRRVVNLDCQNERPR